MTQSLRAVLPSPFQPLADGGGVDPQGLGDLSLSPALLLEAPGMQPSGFFPEVRCRVHAWQRSISSCRGQDL